MFENVNEVAVIVSAVLAIAVGNVWYSSMLFGKQWVRSLGGGQMVGDNDSHLTTAVLKALLVYIVVFFVLAKYIAFSYEVESFTIPHLFLPLFVLVWAHMLIPVIWEKKPMAYFWVHAGYFTLVLLIGLGVLMYWPW